MDKKWYQTWKGWLILFFAFAIFGQVMNGVAPRSSETNAKPAKSAEAIENEREEQQREGLKQICKTLVESSLKAPSTAKWPSFADFQFVHVDGGKSNVYGILGYVDAQNSFGAMLRRRFLCSFKKVGKNYEFIDVIDQ